MKIHCKYDELIPVEKLKPHPKNRNKHSPEQIERLAKILSYQGLRAPIVVSKKSGYIVKGHGTILAIIENGWKEAPIVKQDFEDTDQEYLFVQSDNAIASWAELDLAGINLDIPELGPFDIDLLGIENFCVDPMDRIDPNEEWPLSPDEQPQNIDEVCLVITFKNKEERLEYFENQKFEKYKEFNQGRTWSLHWEK